jgi:hypothetical protein
VIFGVYMAPEEGTSKLHNLDLKFMGEEKFGDGDTWWHEAGDEEEEEDEDQQDAQCGSKRPSVPVICFP